MLEGHLEAASRVLSTQRNRENNQRKRANRLHKTNEALSLAAAVHQGSALRRIIALGRDLPMKRLTITVADSFDLAALIGCLGGDLLSFGMETVADPEPAKRSPHRSHTRRVGPAPILMKRGGQGTVDHTLDVFARKPEVRTADIEDALEELGYRRSSASPALSLLVRDDRITRDAHGVFRLKAKPSEARA